MVRGVLCSYIKNFQFNKTENPIEKWAQGISQKRKYKVYGKIFNLFRNQVYSKRNKV